MMTALEKSKVALDKIPQIVTESSGLQHLQNAPFAADFQANNLSRKMLSGNSDMLRREKPVEVYRYDSNGSGSEVEHPGYYSSEVIDSAERSGNSTMSIKLEKSYQDYFLFDSSCYKWEGVKYLSGQERIANICLSIGPIQKVNDFLFLCNVMHKCLLHPKAFEENCIRVDTELSTVDVVWRERFYGHFENSNREFDYHEQYSSSGVLRREKFCFDDVIAGPSALQRFSLYVRQRTKKALLSSTNLFFLSVACGDSRIREVEPTFEIIAGHEGGGGIASAVIDEAFRFCRPLTSELKSEGKTKPLRSAFLSSKLALEKSKSRIDISMVLFVSCVSGDDSIVDLLSSSKTRPRVVRTRSGSRILTGVNRVRLDSPADFDRIIGIQTGKRIAFNEIIRIFKRRKLGTGDIPLDIFASASCGLTSVRLDQCEDKESEETLLMTVTVSGGTIKTETSFHFITPHGAYWNRPGSYRIP